MQPGPGPGPSLGGLCQTPVLCQPRDQREAEPHPPALLGCLRAVECGEMSICRELGQWGSARTTVPPAFFPRVLQAPSHPGNPRHGQRRKGGWSPKHWGEVEGSPCAQEAAEWCDPQERGPQPPQPLPSPPAHHLWCHRCPSFPKSHPWPSVLFVLSPLSAFCSGPCNHNHSDCGCCSLSLEALGFPGSSERGCPTAPRQVIAHFSVGRQIGTQRERGDAISHMVAV